MSRGQLVIGDKRVADTDVRDLNAAQVEVQGSQTRPLNPEFRLGIVTDATQITAGSTSYYQWLYTVSFVIKAKTGHGTIADGTWVVYGSPQENVINLNEGPNKTVEDAETGSYGNGVDYDDLKAVGTFELPPIPDTVPCLLMRLGDTIDAGGSLGFITEWAIVASGVPNGVTGTCDEE